MLKKNRKGFTLIELIVVMIIIGILVLLATPRFIRYIKFARYTNIIYDTKVMESVVTAHLARHNKLPEDSVLVDIQEIASKEPYIKEGRLNIVDGSTGGILKDTRENLDFAGDISDFGLVDLEAYGPFYRLSKEYTKLETRTRLKGDFIANRDGFVIYTQKLVEISDPSKPEDKPSSTGIFKYADEENKTIDFLASIPLKDIKDFTDEEKEDIQKGIIVGFADTYEPNLEEFPEIPATRTLEDGSKVSVWAINDNAFSSYKFTGTIKLPSSLEVIGFNTFRDSNFQGDFISSGLRIVGRNAFNSSKFSNQFKATNLEYLYGRSFENSVFTGNLIAPKITEIGLSAFKNSEFTSLNSDKPYNFIAENLIALYQDNFINSNFSDETNSGIGNTFKVSEDFKMNFTLIDNDSELTFKQGTKFKSYSPDSPGFVLDKDKTIDGKFVWTSLGNKKISDVIGTSSQRWSAKDITK